MTITIDLTKAAKTTFFAAFFVGGILAFALAVVGMVTP